MNMRSLNRRYRLAWLLLGLAMVASAPAAQAAVVQPFQFTDDFYRSHGIDPTMTLDHYVFPDAKFPECASDPAAPRCRTRLGTSPDPAKYNDVRIVETTIGWRHNGNFLSYMAPSKLTPDSFMTDDAGNLTPDAAATKAVCETFRAFLFPKTNRETLTFTKNPGLPNRRQDNIFETQHGYWKNNPLGCWTLAFVVWDGPNFDGSTCQGMMDDLIAQNGADLDGTAIIQTLNDIEALTAAGCTTVNPRNFDGSEGFPWVV